MNKSKSTQNIRRSKEVDLDEVMKIKRLGQYNTRISIIDFIIKQNFFPKNKKISILEP